MKVTVAATQLACGAERDANIANAERLIREAAQRGANVILIQELFESPYFCKDHLAKHFELALPIAENPAVKRLSRVAAELGVALPLSVFERAENAYFNTLVMVDADGSTLGIYRKSHIPESPGYHEKFYFSPGDTGFRVWRTRFGALGVAVDVYHVWWDPKLESQIARAGRDRLLAYHVCDWLVPTRDLLNDRGMMGDGVIDLLGAPGWTKDAGYGGLHEVAIFCALAY